MDDIIKIKKASEMKNYTFFLNNSDSEDISINRFERADRVLDAEIWKQKELLLQNENREISRIIFNKSTRKYRCNSLVPTNVPDLVFYDKNVRFLAKLKTLAAENIQFLIEEAIHLYDSTFDLNHREILEDFLIILLKFRDASVLKLRESLCEMIFKKSIELDAFIDIRAPPSMTFNGQDTPNEKDPIDFTDELGSTLENNTQVDERTFRKHFKTMLGKLRYTISLTAHYIHYYNLANSSGKRYGNNREVNSPTSINDIDTILYCVPVLSLLNRDSPLIKLNPRLILMDCEMPLLSGIEATQVLERMKADQEIPDIPIIGLSGNDGAQTRDACINAGMKDYLVKPLKEHDIDRLLKHFGV